MRRLSQWPPPIWVSAATIVMPTDAPKAKLASTQAYSPKIVFFDREREDREAIAAASRTETGAVVVPSYDHPWIVAGQGTAALELLEEKPELDAIVVPLGGGGLLSGTLIAAKALRPNIRIFGVEPELPTIGIDRSQPASASPLLRPLRLPMDCERRFRARSRFRSCAPSPKA